VGTGQKLSNHTLHKRHTKKRIIQIILQKAIIGNILQEDGLDSNVTNQN